MLKKEYRSTERYIKAPELFPQEPKQQQQQLQQYETQHLKILVSSLCEDLDEFILAITHQVEIIDFANPELRLNKKQTVSTFETDNLIECEEEFDDSDQQYDDFDQIEYYNYYLHDEYMDHYDADKEDGTDDFSTDLGTEDDEQTEGSRGFLTDLAEYKQRYHVCSTDTEQTTQASLQSVTSSEDDFLQNHTEPWENNCGGLRRSRNFYHIPSEQARLLHEYSMAHVDEVDQISMFTVDHVHDINELHRFASAGGSLLNFDGDVNIAQQFKEEEAGSNSSDQVLKQN